MTAPSPGPALPLAERAAARAGADRRDVDAVMAAHAVPAAPVPAGARSLRVLRLRVAGTKAGVPSAGPFDTTLRFADGVVVAVAPNLRGKTSTLEILCWCLRGSPRELQADVASWLAEVDCDVLLNGSPVAIRLRLSAGRVVTATVLQAAEQSGLERAAAGGPGVQVLASASSDEEYEAAMEALMLDRLGLEPIMNFVASTGGVQTHAWPTYFGAVYPPAGGEKVLIGQTAFGGLAGRLLSVFLDLPGAAVLTRVKAAADALGSVDTAEAARVRAEWQAAAAARAVQQARLDAATVRLQALDAAQGGVRPASQAAAEIAALSTRLADAAADLQGYQAVLSQAKAARIADQRRANDAAEAAAAGRLFHGLDPQSCPRCETAVTKERRNAEASYHACAVCTSPLTDDADPDDDADYQAGLADAAAASAQAADAAARAVREAEDETDALRRRLADAEDELRAARDAAGAADRSAAEREVAQAEGALQVLPVPAHEPPAPPDDATGRILNALAVELEADLRRASDGMFDELGDEVAYLAVKFGMTSVEGISIDRRSAMKIRKGGAGPSSFGAQSPGERLRLRIATVAALLRVGARRGIGTHPGLVMIDSLRAEEIQDADAGALLDELLAVAADTPGLQVITTTQDAALPLGRLPAGSILAPPGGSDSLW